LGLVNHVLNGGIDPHRKGQFWGLSGRNPLQYMHMQQKRSFSCQ